MKRFAFLLCLGAAAGLSAQTAPSASKPAKPAAGAAHHAARTASAAEFPVSYKLPPDEHRIVRPQKKVAVLTYQDIKVGTGAEGETGKLWHVKYKGWRAADGVVFDNWEDHMRPVMGEDGKPKMGPDGKPQMGDPEPLVFPQGVGRLIPGFDYGVAGMHVGGKRRLFIPWQMAYGTRNIPDRPDHPGIPSKSDLIFDVELVDVTDMAAAPQRPMPPIGVRPHPGTPGAEPRATPPVEGKPVQPDATNAEPSKPAAPSTAPAPGQPAQPPQH